jgi:hypothetical protein
MASTRCIVGDAVNAGRTVKDSSRLPSAAEIADINAKHLIRTPLKPADLLFVSGTREDVTRCVDEAFRLWARRFVSLVDRQRRRNAGMQPFGMRNHPGRDDRAGHPGRKNPQGRSRDEYRRERDVLAARDRRRVGIKEYPQRDLPRQQLDRAPLSDDAAPALARGEKMLVTVDSFATPLALWHTDPEFSRRMLSEWEKIEPYRARGFIAEWPAG